MRRFTGHQEKWGDFLDIKIYRKKLSLNRIRGKKILFSSTTDAYNPFERRFNNTRELLKQFINKEVSVEILTKSDLALRDIDIFKQIKNISVGFSLNTLDDTIRRKIEPAASSVTKRIDAVKKLNDEGIDTYIFLSPMFPGITDFKEIINHCKDYTKKFTFENLNLRGTFRPVVMKYIHDYHNDLVPLYDEIYKFKNNEYWEILEREIEAYCQKNNIAYKSYFYHEKIRKK
jgi:DNA repair photolyase